MLHRFQLLTCNSHLPSDMYTLMILQPSCQLTFGCENVQGCEAQGHGHAFWHEAATEKKGGRRQRPQSFTAANSINAALARPPD